MGLKIDSSIIKTLQQCQIDSNYNYCSVLKNMEIDELLFVVTDVLSAFDEMEFRKSIDVGDEPVIMGKIKKLDESGKRIKEVNKTLYRNLTQNLKMMGTSGEFEKLYCVVDGFSNNTHHPNR